MKHLYGILAIGVLLLSCTEEKFPSISIQKEGAIGWTIKEPCSLVYTNTDIMEKLSGKIKCRGGISSKYAKHSFSLELDKKFSFENLPGDDDWILNANYIDKTFMRHKISYDLYREMNEKNIAAQSLYINLNINDTYTGLYILMEEINAGMIGLDKSDTLAMLFKDPPIFYEERLSNILDSVNYYQQKFPKIYNSDKTYYIEKFKNFLFNSTDTEFARDISKWVDIKNVMDWHIILLFTNNSDGLMKNFYLYKIDEDTPLRFAIWDYDHSFGRDGDNERNLLERIIDCNRAILLERLSNIPEIKYLPKLKERWIELRKLGIISYKSFESHISKNDDIIGKEIERNFEKWPINSKWYYDEANYLQELDLMREFVKVRIHQLDNYFNSL